MADHTLIYFINNKDVAVDGLLSLFALLFFLVTLIGFFSFGTLVRWQETHLQILNRGGSCGIGLIFFAAFGYFIITLGLRVHTFSLKRGWHWTALVGVCIYTFVFFNPQANISSANTVYCPDGYAFQLKSGHYIKCEDFDLFHVEQSKGNLRTDLYIGGNK